MNAPLHSFETRLAASWPPESWQDVTVLVGVSGGADSVALLRGLAALKAGGQGRLIVGHFNHCLRGEESDADAEFVKRLAGRLKLHCRTMSSDFSAAGQSCGLPSEDDSRQARMAFYQRVGNELGARYVATAHTADDQAETVLHRILRGTGVSGLAGIARVSSSIGSAMTLIRPLLEIRRNEALDYLQSLGQDFRHDSSNDDLNFTRNRLRHDLLPKLAAEYNPQVVDALLRLAKVSSEYSRFVTDEARELLNRACRESAPESFTADCRVLALKPELLITEALRLKWAALAWPLGYMGETEWRRLTELTAIPLPAERASKIVLPGNVLVERTGDSMRVSRK